MNKRVNFGERWGVSFGERRRHRVEQLFEMSQRRRVSMVNDPSKIARLPPKSFDGRRDLRRGGIAGLAHHAGEQAKQAEAVDLGHHEQ